MTTEADNMGGRSFSSFTSLLKCVSRYSNQNLPPMRLHLT